MGGETEAIPGVLLDPVVDGADAYSDCIGYLLLGEGLVDIEVKGLFLLVCKGHSFGIFVVYGTKVNWDIESSKLGIYDNTLFVLSYTATCIS